MVKFDDIPEEEDRLELDKLQDFMDAHGNRVEFIAIEEKEQEATKDKTGGINIQFQTRVPFKSKYDMETGKATSKVYEDGLKLTQKYSKVSGRALKEQMKTLGLTDTKQLGESYFVYRLQGMRVGFPRLIPVEKSSK